MKTIKYIGDAKFQIQMENGEIKEVGGNLTGVIRYTYFEDYTLPEIGWEITWEKLISDYLPKIENDVFSEIKSN